MNLHIDADELKRLGAIFCQVTNWVPLVITDGLLTTGQNPASSGPGLSEGCGSVRCVSGLPTQMGIAS